jgi:hypothetical protein
VKLLSKKLADSEVFLFKVFSWKSQKHKIASETLTKLIFENYIQQPTQIALCSGLDHQAVQWLRSPGSSCKSTCAELLFSRPVSKHSITKHFINSTKKKMAFEHIFRMWERVVHAVHSQSAPPPPPPPINKTSLL